MDEASRVPRGQAALGWAEFLPRYLLVEDQLADRRVLEIGTRDARSLVKLQDAGAARVVGTTPDPSPFDRSRFHSPAVELLAMDSGRIDFGDHAFDVLLVVDLGLQLAHNPRFLEEVKRVLAPDGFCLLAFPGAGRDLAHLLDPGDVLSSLDTERHEAAVRAVFPQARFLLQTPFVGVAIQPDGRAPGEVDVALEPGLAGGVGRPSHVIALCGRGAPNLSDRTLVELPFTDFEAMTDAVQARVSSDVRRLLAALEDAQARAEARERSLAEVQQRLPKLRAALKAKLPVLDAGPRTPSQIVSPTVLERPEPHDETRFEPREGPSDTIYSPPTPGALEEAVAEAEARASAAESARGALESELAAAMSQMHALRGGELDSSELSEARRRIDQLERTLGGYEQEIEGLRAQVQNEQEVRFTLGSDYRDAESRMNHLRAQIEEQSLLRVQAERKLVAREAFLADALSDVDHERDLLRARIADLEEGEANHLRQVRAAVDGQERSQAEADAVRADLSMVRVELDRLRAEAHAHARENEELHAALHEQEQRIQQNVGSHRAKEADRRAIEMAAGHLSREVEGLRRRVQELRNERDTLAATSQMLLDERDAAREMARRTVVAEEHARKLSGAVDEAEQMIEAYEVEARAAQDRLDNLGRALAEGKEANTRLRGELEATRANLGANEAKHQDSVHRVSSMDQQMAKLQAQLRDAQAGREVLLRERGDLEDMLREATVVARGAMRDADAAQARQSSLQREVHALLDERADLEAARARSEAEVLTAAEARREAETQRALLKGELASVQRTRDDLQARIDEAGSRIQKLSEQLAEAGKDELTEETAPADAAVSAEALEELEALRAAKADADVALGRTLEEAAKLSGHLADLERALEDSVRQLARGDAERLQIERQRQAAAEAARSAEMARVDAQAEIQVLREQVKRLDFERNELARDCDLRSREEQRLLRHARGLEAAVEEIESRTTTELEGQRARLHALEEENSTLRAAAEAVRGDDEHTIEGLQDRAAGLEDRVDALTQERVGLLGRMHELEAQQGLAEERLERAQRFGVSTALASGWDPEEARAAEEEREALVDALEAARSEVRGLRGASVLLRAELLEREERIDALQLQAADLRARAEARPGPVLAVVAGGFEARSEDLAALARRASASGARATEAEERAEALEARVEQLAAALAASRVEQLEARMRRDDAEALLEGLRAERGDVASALAAEAERADERAREAAVRARLEADRAELTDALASARAELDDATKRASEAEWYLGERQAELQGVREQIEGLRADADREAGALRETAEASQAEAERAARDKDAQAEARASAEARTAELEAERDALVAERDMARAAADAEAEAGARALEAQDAAAERAAALEQGLAQGAQALASARAELEASREARIELEEQLAELTAASEAATARADEDRAALDAKSADTIRLEGEVQRLTADLDRLRVELDEGAGAASAEAKAELEARAARIASLEAALEDTQKSAQAARDARDAKVSRLAEADEVRAELERRVEAGEAALAAAEQRATDLRAELDAQTGARDAAEQQLAEASAELAAAASRSSAHEAERAAAMARVVDLETDLGAKAAAREADRAELRALAEARESADAAAAERLAALEAERTEQTARVEALQADLEHSEARAAALELAESEARDQLTSLQTEAETFQGRAEALEWAAEAAASRMEVLAEEKVRLEAALEAAQSANSSAESSKQESFLEAQLLEAEEARRRLDTELAELALAHAKELAEAETQLARAQASRATLQAELEASSAAHAAATEAVATAEQARARAQAAAEAADAERSELAAARALGDDDIAEARAAALAAREARARADAEADELRQQLEQVREAHTRARGVVEAAQAAAEEQRDAAARSATVATEAQAEAKALAAQLEGAREALAEAEAAKSDEGNEALAAAMQRAGEAETRAERAEAKAARAEAEAETAGRTSAQAAARLVDVEARADRAEAALRKEGQRAHEAESRAAHLEAGKEAADARVLDLDSRRRALEGRVQEAETQAQHHARRVEELSAEMRRLEARLRSGGGRADSTAGADVDVLRARARTLEETVAQRDGELKRLRGLSEKLTRELDEARADVGRRLNDLKASRQGLDAVQGQLATARADAERLQKRLDDSGDSAELRGDLARRAEEIAGLNAQKSTLEGERARLVRMIQESEQRQVQGERRVAELETALSERTHRIEMLTRELQEKNERLRRLSGLDNG